MISDITPLLWFIEQLIVNLAIVGAMAFVVIRLMCYLEDRLGLN